MCKHAFLQPDQASIGDPENFFEIPSAGLCQQACASRVCQVDQDIDQGIGLRCSTVLRMKRNLVGATCRILEGVEQLVFETVDLVEHRLYFPECLLQICRRIKRAADQACDEQPNFF